MKALLILFTVAVAFAAKRFDGEQVLRIHPEHEKQLKELAQLERTDIGQRLDFWKGPTIPSHPVDVRVPKDLLEEVKTLLEKTGMKYTVMVEDLQQRISTERSHVRVRAVGFNFDDYNTYDDINAQLQDFAASYPDLASIFTIGYSYEGRAINVIKVGRGDGSNKPAVFLEGQMHARDWVVGATLLYNIKFFLEGYWSDSQITTLMDNMDFYFIPVANPDGYVYSYTDDRMWLKTRSGQYGWSGRACYGVDPNRNWDEHFAGPGTSSDPCSEIYHGPSAFSEAETRAVSDWVKENSNDIKAYLGVYAYSQMWLSPYGWTYTDTPPDFEAQYDLAGRVVSAIELVNGKIFTFGETIAYVFNKTTGSSCDWAYTVAGIKYSYAILLRDEGQYGFVLPASQIRPSADEFFAGLLVLAEQVKSEYCDV